MARRFYDFATLSTRYSFVKAGFTLRHVDIIYCSQLPGPTVTKQHYKDNVRCEPTTKRDGLTEKVASHRLQSANSFFQSQLPKLGFIPTSYQLSTERGCLDLLYKLAPVLSPPVPLYLLLLWFEVCEKDKSCLRYAANRNLGIIHSLVICAEALRLQT